MGTGIDGVKFIPILVLIATPIVGALVTPYLEPFTLIPVSSEGVIPFFVSDVVCIAISLGYGVYPLLYNNSGLLKKDISKITKEYKIVTIILFVEIPLLVIFTFLSSHLQHLYNTDTTFANAVYYNPILNQVFTLNNNIGYFILYSVVGGLLWIGLNKINKDFYFQCAKACFENILDRNEIGKVQYMKKGLKYYNQYLEKILQARINNIGSVTAKLVTDSTVDRDKAIESLYNAFQENDILQPLRWISKNLNINKNELLVEESMEEKIKSLATYIIATLIPTSISIIQLIQKIV